MGRTLDALLRRRNSKTINFKALLSLAMIRLGILKNQRQVRCSNARSDVVQLLNLTQHDRALLRVEHVIKEQNMVDVFVMIEGYCNILIERVELLENNKVCPDELKEATSSLIFAASRCGDFPELQEIRAGFTSRFGKDFTARAAELRNTCGVNPKIIQKLSTRQPSYESRLKVLNEIASENSIVLHLDEEQSSVMLQEKMDLNQKQNESLPSPSANSVRDDTINLTEEVDRDEKLSGSLRARKYRNVASAAQAAFESAANAADAARAAVELSRFGSQDYDRDVESSLTPRKTNQLQGDGSSRKKIGSRGSGFEKIAPIETFDSESECEELTRNRERIRPEEVEEKNKDAEIEKWISSSSSDSDGDTLTKTKICSSISGQTKSSEEIISFENSDNETGNNHGRVPWLKNYDLGINGESTLPSKNFPKSTEKKLMRLNIERPLSVRTKRGNGQ